MAAGKARAYDALARSLGAAWQALPKAKDDVDSEQEVATTVRSLVHASTAGGQEGQGQGGNGPGADPGAGGAIGANPSQSLTSDLMSTLLQMQG